jgi:hypothetical protein
VEQHNKGSAWPREKHTNYLTSDSFPKLPVRDRRFAEEGADLQSTTYPVFTVITLPPAVGLATHVRTCAYPYILLLYMVPHTSR